MSKIGVSFSIDVTRIEKARLIDGKKGKYLDVTGFIDLGEADQYGNHGMLVQSVSKEERQQGVKGPILGNAKVFYRDEKQQRPDYQQAQAQYAQQQGQPQQQSSDPWGDDGDSIPF